MKVFADEVGRPNGHTQHDEATLRWMECRVSDPPMSLAIVLRQASGSNASSVPKGCFGSVQWQSRMRDKAVLEAATKTCGTVRSRLRVSFPRRGAAEAKKDDLLKLQHALRATPPWGHQLASATWADKSKVQQHVQSPALARATGPAFEPPGERQRSAVEASL